MRVQFDTNIVLDVIGEREPFYRDSYAALRLAYKKCTPCVSTTTITDAVYISRKFFSDADQQKKILSDFFSDFKICAISRKTIMQAFASSMSDFEDAVQAFCAKRHGVSYIITRNVKDYKLSPVQALEPADFISLLGK